MKNYENGMNEILPNDVVKIARAIVESRKLPKDMEKEISNILWHLIYPDKELWKEKPHNFTNEEND